MFALLTSLLMISAPTFAGELEGVTMPDTAEVGGQSLKLNGMGLREKFFINVYVGGLYLPEKTTDASKAISSDVPKRIVMEFQYSVSADKLRGAYVEGFEANGGESLKDKVAKLNGFMDSVVSGDKITLDYVPGKGTTVIVKGATKGTIEGADFMKALWSVYLGSSPPTKNLKNGLLGG